MNFLSSLPAGGTIFNSAAILLGGLAGLAAGRFIPERLREALFQCLGLFTMYVGFTMALQTQHALAVLLSLVLGTVTGSLCRLEDRLNALGDALKRKIHTSNERFTEGFVTATLLFCTGAMAIVGAFEDGLRHNPTLLVTKGLMDGFLSLPLAGSLGLGVLFSAPAVLVYQGAWTLLAVWAESLVSAPEMQANISGLGGLMILGIGLNLLGITRLRLCDMLPGLIYVVLLTPLFV